MASYLFLAAFLPPFFGGRGLPGFPGFFLVAIYFSFLKISIGSPSSLAALVDEVFPVCVGQLIPCHHAPFQY